jgi:hypothetical protein
VTWHQIEIEVGDRLQDNDPRMAGRVLTVVGFKHTGDVVAEDRMGRRRTYARHRIVIPGHHYKSGLTLIRKSA